MTMWDFFAKEPVIALFMVFLVTWTVGCAINVIAKRTARTLCIRKQGWPTAPIDADGDVVYPGECDCDDDEEKAA